MEVSAFQQDGIPETIPQPQVNTNRRKHIRQQLLTRCLNFNFLHNNPPKSSLTGGLCNLLLRNLFTRR